MTTLYNLRDSKRKMAELECRNNELIVRPELIYISDAKIDHIESKVHERDKIGAINGVNILNIDERRKYNYCIVNISKKIAGNASELIICKDDAFTIVKIENIQPTDKIIGQYVGEIRFDHLKKFKGFSQ
jgi:hypothetical protein